jgi:hypothetical protein
MFTTPEFGQETDQEADQAAEQVTALTPADSEIHSEMSPAEQAAYTISTIREVNRRLMSRRSFLKLLFLAGSAAMLGAADQLLTGGTFREVFIRCLLDEEYRRKVLQKIQQGELWSEYQQQKSDRTQESEVVMLGEEVLVNEEWLGLLAEDQVFSL